MRNPFRRGSEQTATSGGDRRLAQKLVDRGIAAERSGTPIKALEYFRRAVEADDGFAPAHLNLGIALQAAGDLAAATASCQRAVALDPEGVAAHYNLARSYLLRSEFSQAEPEFRTALKLRDDFPEGWVGLAGALEALGRDQEALSSLDRAIALRGDYVGALINTFTLLRKMGRPEDAAVNSRRVLELEPENYVAHGTLGLSLHALGQLTEAEACYRRALTFNPEYGEAKANLALVLQATDRTQEAIPLLFDSIADEPDNVQLRSNLAHALDGFVLNKAGERERAVLLSLLADENAFAFVVPSILALVKSEEGFKILQKCAQQGEDPFASSIPTVAAFLREPLLLQAMPYVPIADGVVEEVLTFARRCILRRFEWERGLEFVDPQIPEEFTCALARQCFFSAYALFVDASELQRVARLRDALEGALSAVGVNPTRLEASLTVAALYGPLHTLKGCERLVEHPIPQWSESFRPIVEEQIENRRREREIATQIASITTIDDDISKVVRAQYEENPYPRWVRLHSPGTETIEQLSRRLRPGQEVRTHPRPVPILIAGCGTGRQPISVARAYPDSEILAVDLSLTSLGYAARMTQRLGVSNITYRQADILRLGDLDRHFAVIECCGVLHHLEDPMAGWKVLVGLLEPDGLMKVALYSETARRAIRAAREFAHAGRFPSTPEGIRQCRRAIMMLPDGHLEKDVMSCWDFFTLDGCRDLIMHVQEHRFTLPQIEECLEQLDLQLLRLECSTATWNRFRKMFPGKERDADLKAWHEFEEAYPNTFLGCYTFWCCRK